MVGRQMYLEEDESKQIYVMEDVYKRQPYGVNSHRLLIHGERVQ